ncbi:IS1380 family transposase [Marinobacter sp. CA1]|uniref:IS1380 family transposase n=1 Tax=Marinobacter sp. CA1 TaxID=2817656 RepID=UPI001D06CB65|nr:IS1380 family transposase [Marinobacter sp. CA1]UDL05817.1 IS1380 family transposase [Marinobacter sp. CA1]
MVPEKLTFSPLARRQIEADFSGGHITSDAGLLLLREVDRQHRLTSRLASVLQDPRTPEMVRHKLDTMVRQRVFGVAAGYEDLNDHEALRFDQALQTAVDQDNDLAGKSTLCRMEQRVDRQAMVKAHELLWHHFIEQHDEPPKQIVLDFDGTDIPVHGEQPGKFFNGYYDHHCYFPLYVFCGRHLLVSYLRTSNRSDSRHSWAILALLVRFIRQYWPDTRIVFRGDSGFYRPRILSWCDHNDVDYIVGISKNSRLLKEVDVPMMLVRTTQWQVKEKVAETFRFQYQAKSWKYPRWVVARLEEGELGSNPRFIISSRYDDGFKLYYEQYCARGDMENRIKDQQLSLFADRTSSTHWWTNQWRLILSGFAYTLFERLRSHLRKTPFERMSASTLRLKLIKVGAVIIRNTRRVRVLMSDTYPYKDELSDLVRRLVPG